MPGHFDFWTVLFSFAIASLAGFVAFESIEHTRSSSRPAAWTVVGGVMLGLGIWSMHFVGMLAWEPPFPLFYSLPYTLLSVLAAVAASWLAMHLTVSYSDGAPRRNILLGSVVVGAGICGMHYLGMHALRFTLGPHWNVPGVLLSFAIAVSASLGAMVLLRRSRRQTFSTGRQGAASLVIGLAICGMHYTGMMAMDLPAGSLCLHPALAFSGLELGRVGVGNALVLTVCLLVVFHRDKMRWIAAANDARFEVQEAKRHAERLGAAGKIAASIAHEINNPLEAVTNLLYLVEQGKLDDEERHYLMQAQEELGRIAEITTHTLKFYRQQGAPAETSLPELFESALAVFQRRLTESHIAVVCHWTPDAPRVTCRAGEIRQVFANLISNAIDAMPRGGELILAVRGTAEEGAEIEIADTGGGISPDVQARILEPFFSTKGAAGTGLGLSITAEILERHGGTLRFSSSTEPGRSGTRFLLFLPKRMPGVAAATA